MAWHDKYDKARARLLRMHYESHAGHIGGNLSCLDALLVLYHRIMTEEDRFVLSKGHAAGAWYVALWSKGLLDSRRLETFSRDGGLPGHPSGDIPGLLFPTGSLGHGLSLSSGLALAAKLRGKNHRVYCLCSDGEWQEGSNWEALIFLIKHRLNVSLLIDCNGWQGFGSTDEVSSIADLAPRLASFEIPVSRCDGHDFAALENALTPRPDGPTVLILDTVKGHGLPFFEGRLESHYLPMTESQYLEAAALWGDGEGRAP